MAVLSSSLRRSAPAAAIRPPLSIPILVVFLSGVNLVLVQWMLVRELTALLMGTELVVLLVTVMYFLGLSLGYMVSGSIPVRWLPRLGVAALILHLTLPIWFRMAAAGLASIDAYWAAFLLLPLVTPLVVSSFYSVFLPLYADQQQAGLPALYAVELLGSACGVLVLVAFGGMGLSAVLIVYAVNLLILLLALGLRRWIVAAVAVLCSVWITLFPVVNGWSNARWYEALHELPQGLRTLTTSYSAYQKVDVLEAPSGDRYLYLDGLLHYGTDRWSRLNVIMGAVSADLIQPRNSLVVGAGSMEMERFIAERGGHVTTVELDPAVIEASSTYLNDVNSMDMLPNRSVIIDDAKHYMANAIEVYDLIATDVPAAFSIQTATLYSQPFYEHIARRLSPQGVLVVNLTSRLTETSIPSRRIARTLLAVFDELVVVTSNDSRLSYAFAGDSLPFGLPELQAALEASGEQSYTLYQRAAVEALTRDVQPITLDSMDLVLQISASWIADRLSSD
ncbi:MAG: hypothetical protein IPK19_20220 [Chloroflexi bacterium]|nr:hypothetical protein [Chloroflexota bacterium]